MLKDYVATSALGEGNPSETRVQDHWFQTKQILDLGSAVLCDTSLYSLFRISPTEYQHFLGKGHSQLRRFRQLGKRNFEVQGSIPHLEWLDLSIGTGLGPYLCSNSEGADETRLSIRELRVAGHDKNSLECFLSHSTLRTGLAKLSLELESVKPDFVFDYSFSELESLELIFDGLSSDSLLELPDIEALCSRFPRLNSIAISLELYGCSLIQGDIRSFSDFFKLCQELAPSFIRLESWKDEFERFSSIPEFWQLINPMVSDLVIDYDFGCFMPTNFASPDKIESIEILFSADWRHESMSVQQAAELFCQHYSAVKRLKIESSQICSAIFESSSFCKFRNLRVLDCALDLDHCSPAALRQITELGLDQLKLKLSGESEGFVDKAESLEPVRAAKVSLDLYMDAKSSLEICKRFKGIESIQLHIERLGVEDLFNALSANQLRGLKVLFLRGNSGAVSRFFHDSSIDHWRRLKLDNLIWLSISQGVPPDLAAELYEHFPSLLHIGEPFGELIGWPFES